jgi:hypothetical protein
LLLKMAVGAAVLGFCFPLEAGELQPPLQSLRHANFTLVVAEPVDGEAVEGRMSVRVSERLRGDPEVPDVIELLVQAGDQSFLKRGETYLLFYSDVERVSFKPRKEVRRPDRRKLLHIDGADPAVFPDTAAMRALFDPKLALPEESPRYHDLVIQGLQSDNPVMVDLWSAEWALRPATFPEVEPGEVNVLRDIIEDPRQRPAARTRLLQAASQRSPADMAEWYVSSAAAVLGQVQPAQLAENEGLAQLIDASLRVARSHPNAATAPQLEKWLKATPPLAENAALALRAIDPELEREAVESAIADLEIPEQTRSFLSDHLRRADLAANRSS